MKKGEVWIVKMNNNYDETEFDRWMFNNLKETYAFLDEYLPGNGLVVEGVHEFLDDLMNDAYKYLYARRDLDEGGIEIFSVGTAKPIAKDYIVS